MTCRYVFLESAKEELDEVAAYILAETGSKQVTRNFLESIQQVIDITCEFPTMHAVSRMSELAGLGYRVMFAGSYVLLYTIEDDVLFIAHVFHQRQDYTHLI